MGLLKQLQGTLRLVEVTSGDSQAYGLSLIVWNLALG